MKKFTGLQYFFGDFFILGKTGSFKQIKQIYIKKISFWKHSLKNLRNMNKQKNII